MRSVLAIGAHPDDIELGCGATLLAHSAAGDQVTMFVMTGGENGPGDDSAIVGRRAEQEQAARTLGAGPVQTFRRITVPVISGALGYGTVLCFARAIGEYGAVAVVSGRLVGQTQTLPLYVEERFENFDQPAAFAVATLLAAIAAVTLVSTRLLRSRGSS